MINNKFKEEVKAGLESNPKTLPSKYFYNKKGDALFVEIMNMPEYYLTRSEFDIFKNKTQELINAFDIKKDTYFELIELGAGDGTKTKELLKKLINDDYNFDYFPIDISANALKLLDQDLKHEIPNLNVKTMQGDYFGVLDTLKENKKPKVILFLGSNIGNMADERATEFIYNLGNNLNPGDKLLLGVDIIKSKKIVGPAYNDSTGITAAFNMNLLDRINNELGGNFNLDQFKHQPEYDEKEGIAKSFIVSTANQSVSIEATGKTFHFTEGEKIHTEISRKYNDQIIEKISSKTDLSISAKILDGKAYFADYILTRN